MLNGQQQYVVPLFQRSYSWKQDQWETLWLDIMEVYESDVETEHFLGSIVTLGQIGRGPELITPYILIDGQQRITTLCVLLGAIRDIARGVAPDLATQIHALYLTNQLMTGLDRFKILPTQVDRAAFFEIIDNPNESATSRMAQAFSYFLRKLRAGDGIDLANLQRVVLDKLNLVSIKLAQSDNAYRIFESLNAKGMRLTQSDLLRNYFFMRLPIGEHELLYNSVWSPMQIGSIDTASRETWKASFETRWLKTATSQGTMRFTKAGKRDSTRSPTAGCEVNWRRLPDSASTTHGSSTRKWNSPTPCVPLSGD